MVLVGCTAAVVSCSHHPVISSLLCDTKVFHGSATFSGTVDVLHQARRMNEWARYIYSSSYLNYVACNKLPVSVVSIMLAGTLRSVRQWGVCLGWVRTFGVRFGSGRYVSEPCLVGWYIQCTSLSQWRTLWGGSSSRWCSGTGIDL